MTKLNRKIEYSLMALKYIQERQSNPKVTAKEVADAVHAPFEVIARVMQVMAQKGLLASEQGASGGYRLNQELKNISLFQLVEIIEGPTALVKCITEDGSCDIGSSCNIASPLKSLNNKLNSFFKNIPLSELLTERAEDLNHV
jgi:Rrf2 family transcriptional regulator, nitric oxide-sensitive transcriptional repressor